MSAKESINPDQLRLFYTAQQLQDSLNRSGDLQHGESMGELWDRKLTESKAPAHTAHGAGVYQSIRKNGWFPDTKFRVMHSSGGMRIPDGHHRLAALAEIERKYGARHDLFVEHNDDSLRKWTTEGRPTWSSTSSGQYQPLSVLSDDESSSMERFRNKVKNEWGW